MKKRPVLAPRHTSSPTELGPVNDRPTGNSLHSRSMLCHGRAAPTIGVGDGSPREDSLGGLELDGGFPDGEPAQPSSVQHHSASGRPWTRSPERSVTAGPKNDQVSDTHWIAEPVGVDGVRTTSPRSVSKISPLPSQP